MMHSYRFVASQLADGREHIALYREQAKRLLRPASRTQIAFAEWPRHAPHPGLLALSAAQGADTPTPAIETEDGVILSPQAVARLDEIGARALGLPPALPLVLQLRAHGSLAEGTIGIELKWLRHGDQIVRATVSGARLNDGRSSYRIPEPVYSTARAAVLVNAAKGPDARRAAFASLRTCLGEKIAATISADGFIERLRIAYAASFSLDVKTEDGEFEFDPVLFADNVTAGPDGNLVDAQVDSLLTPNDSRHFQQKFREQQGSRRSYVLPDGTLLFMDPNLGAALEVVRRKQQANAAERQRFLASPQRVLREELGLDQDGDDTAADRLFIETQQFSDRVRGIEVWAKPVLPWIKPKPNSWLPEKFGIRIGNPPDDTRLELAPGEAIELHDSIHTAMQAGCDSVSWRGTTIPANDRTRAAIDSIAALERSIAADAPDTATPPPGTPQTFFLQVGDNFEEVSYGRLPAAATPAADRQPPSLPSSLISVPKPHQITGFNWLAEAWACGMPGVLLADDMGLGKTFQLLMFLALLRQQEKSPAPALIVAPTGLLRNWLAEIRQHLQPQALGRVVEAYGRNLARVRERTGTDIRGGTSGLDVRTWSDAGIVLTTYETMRDYHMSFARIPFAAIVYDEIQKLKNPASQMSRASKALNGRLQIGLTGTPVENRLQDLWSIADTLYPGFLGASRSFEASYPASDTTKLQQLQAVITSRHDTLPPFMLRRMKDEILDGLPAKQIRKYEVRMPAPQADAYDMVLARARALRESGDRGAMLKILHLLRGTSLHPQPPQSAGAIDSYINGSARLQKTFAILHDIQLAGEKALIFCEDLEMQAFLATAIHQRLPVPRRPMCISGKVSGLARQKLVDAFQSAPPGFDVMILSPRAGGVGLTITAANHVIHLSRWWNPAVEDQATDRVYRIGQHRPVTVHIPMAVHPDPAIAAASFDLSLDALMERKRHLSRGLLLPPESEHDIDDLLADVLDGRNTPADEPASQPAAPTAAPRPVLHLRKTPQQAAEERAVSVRRVEYKPRVPRDWTIFEQYLQDARLLSLEIEDPYCCGDDSARANLAQLVGRLAATAQRIEAVHIRTYDADSIDLRAPETTAQQRRDLEQRWKRISGSPALHLYQLSRRAGRDFHDRKITAQFTNGDKVIWDIGRGIDGIMNARFGCVVNATMQPAGD